MATVTLCALTEDHHAHARLVLVGNLRPHHIYFTEGSYNCSSHHSLFQSSPQLIMKSSTIALTLLASSTEVLGFPQLAVDQLAKLAAQSGEKLPRLLQEKHEDLKRQAGFDAGAQAVSVTGEHAFVAPNFGAGDQRGPCPGLNAAANHGYIDHSGVDTFNNILAGVNEGKHESHHHTPHL